jgi:hypothetical protein
LSPKMATIASEKPSMTLGWSPEQIPGRRKREDPGMQPDTGLRLLHEAIYAAIHALPCSA